MTKRRRILAISTAAAMFTAAFVWWMVTWEPSFYSRTLQNQNDSETIRKLSKSMVQGVMQFADEVRNESTFQAEFTEEQVNAWLADELDRKYPRLFPSEISQPRIHFGERLFEVAFRFKRGYLHTVGSSQVKLTVTDDHLLALEIETLRAGRLPLPVADLLEPLVEKLRRENHRVEWRQINGREMLVLDLLSPEGGSLESTRSERVLETVELKPGVLRLKGRRRIPKGR